MIRPRSSATPFWIALALFGAAWSQAQAPAPTGPELVIQTASNPILKVDVAMDESGRAMVVWAQDFGLDTVIVFAQRFESNGSPLGPRLTVSDSISGSNLEPAVALAPDGISTVVWSALVSPTVRGIYYRRYDATGMTIEGPVRVSFSTDVEQSQPAVAVRANGDHIMLWRSEGQDGDGGGVYALWRTANGSTVASEFLINQTITGTQEHPDAVFDPELGGIRVTWTGDQTGSKEVYARAFASTTAPFLGGEFQVNTFTTDIQDVPKIAVNRDRQITIVWQSRNQDGSGSGIYGQRFAPSTSAIGTEFRVNTTTASTQNRPNIAIANDSALVVWESFANDGDDYGVFGQAFDSQSAPVFGERQINTTTAGTQWFPAVEFDSLERGMIVWISGPDGGAQEVRGRQFTSLLFSDGFETGSTERWSASAP